MVITFIRGNLYLYMKYLADSFFSPCFLHESFLFIKLKPGIMVSHLVSFVLIKLGGCIFRYSNWCVYGEKIAKGSSSAAICSTSEIFFF